MLPIFNSLFEKIETEGILPNSLYEASITLTPNPKTLQENCRAIFLTNINAKSTKC
jgi:hypothetical protein